MGKWEDQNCEETLGQMIVSNCGRIRVETGDQHLGLRTIIHYKRDSVKVVKNSKTFRLLQKMGVNVIF